jgi:hypothetical protein
MPSLNWAAAFPSLACEKVDWNNELPTGPALVSLAMFFVAALAADSTLLGDKTAGAFVVIARVCTTA